MCVNSTTYLVLDIIKIILTYLCIIIGVAYFTLAERKIMGNIQRRDGPIVVGFFGLLQPISDALKLMFKEFIVPLAAHKFLFLLAPIYFLTLSLSLWIVLPYSQDSWLADIDYGILYIYLVSSLSVFGVIFAGWSSNSKYALLGALRSAAQMISYEVSLGFCFIIITLVTGTFNLYDIINSQKDLWNIFIFGPFIIIFLISILAETNRAPFDLPEAEGEIVAGYNIDYSGIPFAMFFLAEYANMFFMSCLTTILFLGGGYISYITLNPNEMAAFFNISLLSDFTYYLISLYYIVYFLFWKIYIMTHINMLFLCSSPRPTTFIVINLIVFISENLFVPLLKFKNYLVFCLSIITVPIKIFLEQLVLSLDKSIYRAKVVQSFWLAIHTENLIELKFMLSQKKKLVHFGGAMRGTAQSFKYYFENIYLYLLESFKKMFVYTKHAIYVKFFNSLVDAVVILRRMVGNAKFIFCWVFDYTLVDRAYFDDNLYWLIPELEYLKFDVKRHYKVQSAVYKFFVPQALWYYSNTHEMPEIIRTDGMPFYSFFMTYIDAQLFSKEIDFYGQKIAAGSLSQSMVYGIAMENYFIRWDQYPEKYYIGFKIVYPKLINLFILKTNYYYPLLFIKASTFNILYIVVRSALPRVRYDQLMYIGWKVFLPAVFGYLFFFITVFTYFDAFITHFNLPI